MIGISKIEQIGSFLAILIIFALILYLSYVCSKKVARMSMKDNHSKYMRLVDRIMLGQDKYVAIINIGERYFLIGMAAGEINILTELTGEDLTEQSSAAGSLPAGLDFREVLKKFSKDKDSNP